MNQVLKYLGVIILLIGVAVLAIPDFSGQASNSALLTGLILIVVGYVSHIFLSKRFE